MTLLEFDPDDVDDGSMWSDDVIPGWKLLLYWGSPGYEGFPPATAAAATAVMFSAADWMEEVEEEEGVMVGGGGIIMEVALKEGGW